MPETKARWELECCCSQCVSYQFGYLLNGLVSQWTSSAWWCLHKESWKREYRCTNRTDFVTSFQKRHSCLFPGRVDEIFCLPGWMYGKGRDGKVWKGKWAGKRRSKSTSSPLLEVTKVHWQLSKHLLPKSSQGNKGDQTGLQVEGQTAEANLGSGNLHLGRKTTLPSCWPLL